MIPAPPSAVPDALADARFADKPLVQGDPKTRFHAGVPVGSWAMAMAMAMAMIPAPYPAMSVKS